MNIFELRAREDLDSVMMATLAQGWSEQYGHPFSCSLEQVANSQTWFLQPRLSAYFCGTPSKSSRRYLKNSFRYTPRLERALPQFFWGTALGSRAGLRLSRRQAFFVTPHLLDVSHLLVVPGNQRIRLFDFKNLTSRVLHKAGFPDRGFQNDIEIRGNEAIGPFVPISRHGETWFEEPLFAGYCLPRCPPWLSRSRAQAKAFEHLRIWLAKTEIEVSADSYVCTLAHELEQGLKTLAQRHPREDRRAILAWLPTLVAHGQGLRRITTTHSHGDFQPGNVMVSENGRDVRLIDWEYSRRRSSMYDWLVYGLAARSGRGFAQRLLAFTRGNTTAALSFMKRDRGWRRSIAALFLLEDISWCVQQSLDGPFFGASSGLRLYQAELSTLGTNLRVLFP